MATMIQVYDRAAGYVDGQQIKAGSVWEPTQVSVDGKVLKRRATIANAANATIYSDELGDFEYLRLASDYDVRALVTDNASATYNVNLRGTNTAGDTGVPFVLASDLTSNSTTRVNAIQVFNNSGYTATYDLLVID